jgi:alkylation response protein AidB-like acyl-CoA dehydrogenase
MKALWPLSKSARHAGSDGEVERLWGVAMAKVINRRDLDFLLNEWLDMPSLLGRGSLVAPEVADIGAMLDAVQELAERDLAAHMQASDHEEPSLLADGTVRVLPAVAQDVLRIRRAGVFGAVFSEELGGLALPNVVYVAALGLLMGGCIATASYVLLTVANARLIGRFGNKNQINTFVRAQAAGESLGTMCLSESQAGSSLADIRTRADPDGEDALGKRFRLTGAKMWISAGEHDVTDNIIHLVLAKMRGADGQLAEGSEGISLFIVPKQLPDGTKNDISVAGLNHKMGYKGIPNCALNFGEGRHQPWGKAGAIGWLVGAPGEGLSQMFHMMNEARVSVGLGAAMLAYRGYLSSLSYARLRKQGRAPGIKSGAPRAIVEHADVKRMLLAQKSYAEGALALVLLSARLLDDQSGASDRQQREEAAELLALLTPVTKTFASEGAQQSLNWAIQVLGGAGYTQDYEIEQLYRDNRLNPIHEGTTGIQAIDLVGRKIRRDGGRRMALLRNRVEATIVAANEGPVLKHCAEALKSAWEQLRLATSCLLDEPEERRALALATPYLFAFGHAVVGWIWLDQSVVAARGLNDSISDSERHFRTSKINTCRYFCDFHLPEISAWLNPILVGHDLTIATPIEELLGEAP